ncbi:MAG: ComEC family competence protein, partial [Phycisphaerae bacterium]
MKGVSRTIMRTAPLFPVAGGLILGVVLDRSLHIPSMAYIALLVLMSVVTLFERIRVLIGPVLVFVASICVGGALHLNAARTIPASSIERYTGETRRIARVRGVVVSEPRVLERPPNPFSRWTYGQDRTIFLLEPEWIEGASDCGLRIADCGIPVTGRVRVTVGEAVLDLRQNERVEVFGWLYRFQPPRNPGAFDWAGFYRRQGIVAGMSCKHQESVVRLDHGLPSQRFGFRTWLRSTARGLLTDDLATGADEEASLLEAMVLGHRSRLDRRLNDIFIRAGCIHFLAVSGTHVVVLLSFVWGVGRIFMRTKRQCAWLMIAAVCVYALVAEPRPPILRATVMALLFCGSLILRRPRARLNWISTAAVGLLVCDPTTVFDVGFQLSFAAVLGVSYLTPALL